MPRAVQMCLWREMAVTSGVPVAPALSQGLDRPCHSLGRTGGWTLARAGQ